MLKRDELTDPKSCLNRAKDDEMTFVLLGRDHAAPIAIFAWIDERIRLGKNKRDDPQIVEAAKVAEAILESQGRSMAHFGGVAGPPDFNHCCFEVYSVEREAVTIRDLGHGKSITNDAEYVVEQLRESGLLPNGRRLFYFDTQGDLDDWDETGKVSFRPGPQRSAEDHGWGNMTGFQIEDLCDCDD